MATPFAQDQTRVIVDQQVAAVGQREGIDARIRIGQIGERHAAPGLAAVGGPDFEDPPLPRTAQACSRPWG